MELRTSLWKIDGRLGRFKNRSHNLKKTKVGWSPMWVEKESKPNPPQAEQSINLN